MARSSPANSSGEAFTPHSRLGKQARDGLGHVDVSPKEGGLLLRRHGPHHRDGLLRDRHIEQWILEAGARDARTRSRRASSRRRGDLLLESSLHLGLHVFDDREEESLLGRIEDVVGALGDAGRAGQLVDRGGADASPRKEILSCGEQPLADGGAFAIGEGSWHDRSVEHMTETGNIVVARGVRLPVRAVGRKGPKRVGVLLFKPDAERSVRRDEESRMEIDHTTEHHQGRRPSGNGSSDEVWAVMTDLGAGWSGTRRSERGEARGPARAGDHFAGGPARGASPRCSWPSISPRVGWRGKTFGIHAVHVWHIEPAGTGVRVRTEESWRGWPTTG